jgi:hypothetical protein
MHSPNVVHETHDVEAMTFMKDATSALRSLGQKHSEALCTMRVSQSVSKRRATSLSTTVRLTLASS